jgi:metal-responsive CopG/Arc/MetJ family transcriptional regulator
MAKSIGAKQKKGRGRPATGTDPMIGVRIGKELTAEIDVWAEANSVSRSEAIRRMIVQVLSASKKKGR